MFTRRSAICILKKLHMKRQWRNIRNQVGATAVNTQHATGAAGKCQDQRAKLLFDVHRPYNHGVRFWLSRDKNLPMIYLFTKDGCTLCDEAKVVLQPYMHRFTLEEVDITLPENEDWYEMYKYDIPVFHIYEDFLFKHRVDLSTLEAALQKYETHGIPGHASES